MKKFTPGPWRATSGGLVWAATEQRPANSIADVYSCTAGSERGQNEERNANATLIAAAPEMLEVLHYVSMNIGRGDGNLNPKLVELQKLMKSAIARATGGEK
jgi:hypothetical protein